MKELTIEQKAKAYDKVREKIALRFGSNVTEEIFSEFEMSEDEKIRKQILSFLKEFERDHYRNIDFSSWIAWLEKQGKPIYNVPSREVILAIWDLGNDWKELTNGCISTEYGTQLDYIQKHWEESEYYLREKQGEQKTVDKVEPKDYNSIDPHFGKPIDKVEPKFHKGDWIVHYGTENIYQVVAVIDNQYQLKYGDNYTVQKCADVDRCARVWDVAKDAKAGDVLVDGNLPFIFKKIDTNKYIYAYCGISVDDGFRIESEGKLGEWTWMQDIKPATREQCDTLEKAMTDAGYAFSFEKKKLEQVEQKPAKRSEEDEAVINKAVLWLDTLCDYLKDSSSECIPDVKDVIDKLKSLIPKNRWKPSEEQMRYLLKYAEQNNYDGTILTSLYKDLKRLCV